MLVRDLETMAREAARLARHPVVALDTETSGLDPLTDTLLLVAFSNGVDTLLCDVRGLPVEGVRAALAPLVEGGPVKALHHAKFDLRMLMPLGLEVRPLADTMLNEQILENGRRESGFSLSELSSRYLGLPLDKAERQGFIRMAPDEAFTPAQLEYARRDVLATWQILVQQMARVQREGARKVARLEALAVPAFADMEQRGVLVDAVAWREVIRRAQAEGDAARAEMDRHFRKVANVDLLGAVDLNYDSDVDVRDALGKLGVHLQSTQKGELLHSGHPAAVALVAYREAHKLVSTYGESFLSHVHPRTGRIHASFRQIGASTGRVSCERPNLQNVPKDSALRSCFHAPPGRALITADYAACELRILAHLSRDPVFLAAFERGEDVHAKVASQVFGVPVSKQSHPELRERAKAISFGLIYGMGAAGLAAQTGQSLDEAEALLAQYFRQFPRIDATLHDLERQVRERGYAQTVLGRRLYLERDFLDRQSGAAARLSRNMPIQGTSADITKLAMAFIHERLRGRDAFLVNTVHDELLIECPAAEAERVGAEVKQEMERAMAAVVPGVSPLAEVRVGDTWAKG
ncbi:MAG: DNA polymerase [Myxococcota bacterium]